MGCSDQEKCFRDWIDVHMHRTIKLRQFALACVSTYDRIEIAPQGGHRALHYIYI